MSDDFFSNRHPSEWRNFPPPARMLPTAIPTIAGMTIILLVLAVTLLAVPLAAQQFIPPAPYAYNQLDNPRAETEAQDLMETLRCLECQSQSIADSDAPMAGAMRHQIRTRINAGEEPEAIRQWLVERYGDYVSYAPTVSRTTWPLYLGPLILLLVAGLLIWRRIGRKPASKPEDAV